MLFVFLLACFVASQAATARPVPLVMWHGMGESVTPTVAPYVVITQTTWSVTKNMQVLRSASVTNQILEFLYHAGMQYIRSQFVFNSQIMRPDPW